MSAKLPEYTVIRDTREQEGHGWFFHSHAPDRYPPRCKGMMIDTLSTGDYSLLGYEDILTIERKQDFGELWTCFFDKKRFEAELERMKSFKYRLIVVESILNHDMFNLTPPQCIRNMPGKALMRWLTQIMIKYTVPIIYAGTAGRKVAQLYFEEVVKIERI